MLAPRWRPLPEYLILSQFHIAAGRIATMTELGNPNCSDPTLCPILRVSRHNPDTLPFFPPSLV